MSTSTSPVDIRADHLEIVQDILRSQLPAGVKVWVFGSRANWTTKDSSDLDLAVEGAASLDHGVMVGLEIAFEESDLPYTVDVVDLKDVSPEFKNIVDSQKVPLLATADHPNPAEEWEERPFEEVIDFREGPGILAKDFREDGVPLVRLAGLSRGASVLAGCNYLDPESAAKRWDQFRLEFGDVLLSTSASLGRIAVVGEEGIGAVPYTGIIRMRPRDTTVHRPFIRYLLEGPDFQQQCEMVGVGSVIRHFGPMHLRQMTLKIPPLPQQRAIAHVLGILDDKIELNRRMNQTLEEIARATFQDWFVDFGPVRAKLEGSEPYLPPDLWSLFPDRLVDSELGEIPEGWRVRSVEDVASVVGGSTPSTKVPEYWNGGINCWATPKDLSGLSVPVLLDTERKITESGLGRISSGLLPTGTVLLSSRAPIGYFAINEIPTAVNQGFIAMSPKPPVSNLFLLNWCATAVDDIVSHANGSTFLEVSKSNFRQISLVVPPYPLMESYHHTATNIHRKMVDNEYSSRTLNAQRNALLPKLVSGEVRICKCRQPARKG